MATKADREKARDLIAKGSDLAQQGANEVEAAYELLGKPRFAGTRLFGASGELHDFRAFTSRLDAFARSDIYHDHKGKGGEDG